jgi:hypothetical protein
MRRLSVLCAVALAFCAAGRGLAAEGTDLAQARAAAHKYLELLASDDRAQLRQMQPSAPQHLYGPYPFLGVPSLGQPKVDAHRAGLEFRGKAADSSLPSKGAIILTKEDKDSKEPWKIRSMLWYEELPVGVQMPKTSVTQADVAQEPRARRAVESYLRAWRDQNWPRMKVLTFDWLSAKVETRTERKLRSAELRLTPMRDGEVRVDYTASVAFKLLLVWVPRTVTGRLYCVREDGTWKVRGGAFML